MVIGETFKNAIKGFFYKHSVDVHALTNSTDTSDGFNSDSITGTKTSSFLGNVNLNPTGEKIQQKYGYVKDLAGTITTSLDNSFTEDSVAFKYNGIFYKVFKKVIFDSHILYVIQNNPWE